MLLVGGSTRIPMVQSFIKVDLSAKILTKNINPDEAVAIGAALQSGILWQRGKRSGARRRNTSHFRSRGHGRFNGADNRKKLHGSREKSLKVFTTRRRSDRSGK